MKWLFRSQNRDCKLIVSIFGMYALANEIVTSSQSTSSRDERRVEDAIDIGPIALRKAEHILSTCSSKALRYLGCDGYNMIENAWTPSKALLSPSDLEVLELFLAAWCEENRVDRNDAAAGDIASALIRWYQQDPNLRSEVHIERQVELLPSAEIEMLLRQIT